MRCLHWLHKGSYFNGGELQIYNENGFLRETFIGICEGYLYTAPRTLVSIT